MKLCWPNVTNWTWVNTNCIRFQWRMALFSAHGKHSLFTVDLPHFINHLSAPYLFLGSTLFCLILFHLILLAVAQLDVTISFLHAFAPGPSCSPANSRFAPSEELRNLLPHSRLSYPGLLRSCWNLARGWLTSSDCGYENPHRYCVPAWGQTWCGGHGIRSCCAGSNDDPMYVKMPWARNLMLQKVCNARV